MLQLVEALPSRPPEWPSQTVLACPSGCRVWRTSASSQMPGWGLHYSLCIHDELLQDSIAVRFHSCWQRDALRWLPDCAYQLVPTSAGLPVKASWKVCSLAVLNRVLKWGQATFYLVAFGCLTDNFSRAQLSSPWIGDGTDPYLLAGLPTDSSGALRPQACN